MCGLCVWHMHTCVSMHALQRPCACTAEAWEDIRCPDLSFFYLVPLRQGLSLNLKLGWQPASPSDTPFYTISSAGDLNSGFHACTPSTVTYYAISPEQILYLVHFTQHHHHCHLKKQTETSMGTYFKSVQREYLLGICNKAKQYPSGHTVLQVIHTGYERVL